MHLLNYVSKCTITDSPFNTQANCSKCPLSAGIHFLTLVTREFVTLRSNAELSMLLAALRIRWSSSLVFTLFATPYLSCNVTHVNLMGSDPVTVVTNYVYRHDQSIDLGFLSPTSPILSEMESTIQETPIYGIVIILMELSKSTTDVSFP